MAVSYGVTFFVIILLLAVVFTGYLEVHGYRGTGERCGGRETRGSEDSDRSRLRLDWETFH